MPPLTTLQPDRGARSRVSDAGMGAVRRLRIGDRDREPRGPAPHRAERRAGLPRRRLHAVRGHPDVTDCGPPDAVDRRRTPTRLPVLFLLLRIVFTVSF